MTAHRTTDGVPFAFASRPRRSRRLAHASMLFALGASSFESIADSSPIAATQPVRSVAVRQFQIEGNTVLPTERIQEILKPATGAEIDLPRLRSALVSLREAYRLAGYPNASLKVPRQLMTEGTLTLHIQEGRPSDPANPATNTTASTNSPVPAPTPAPVPPPGFEVRRYEVLGNTVLAQEIVDAAFTNAIGPRVTFGDIQSSLGKLQLAYRERGFATVSVGLPQQQLTNATVKVQVTEGILTSIQVVGNQHFSSNNVLRALPSLRTNELLNGKVFQRELDIANQNRDRQIYPTVGPGPEPGTSAVTLRVKDRLPIHGRVEINNHSTPASPDWRVNASLQHNNLWQLEHQLGLNYSFTPDAYKSGTAEPDYLLNRPLIANVGGYYRLPFGAPESVGERIASNRTFGFDEATRQFRLPPPGARPDLTVFASTASTDTGVQYSPARVVSQTPLLTIVSQDTGQNLSLNDTVGTRFNLPLALGRTETRRFGLSFGPDLRRFSLESFNTNNFIITTVVTNAQGSQTIESRVSSPQPTRKHDVTYLPLALGADFSQSDRSGVTSATLTVSGNALGTDEDFAPLGYSRDAQAAFVKATAFVTREQRFSHDWSILARAAGQVASGPLLGIEQFSVGGVGSVRGYFEGDEFGDSGWFASLESRTPFLLERVAVGSDFPPVWIRGSGFVDVGQRILHDNSATSEPTRSLLGTGFGVSANINNRVDLRILVGWPLLDTPITPAGTPRVYFSLGGQF